MYIDISFRGKQQTVLCSFLARPLMMNEEQRFLGYTGSREVKDTRRDQYSTGRPHLPGAHQ